MPYPHTAPVTAVLPLLKISTQVNAPIAALPDVVGFPILNENTKLMNFEVLVLNQSHNIFVKVRLTSDRYTVI